ncbi:MAG: Valine-tRNA ligase [Candidatus Uhrbacteria bacterium GW2011_GWF2_41_430]|nr:MAG: Valine-tRNA ligase [Candidatus Uhrbacteria bacterium GW2011_GWF2_41_430]
MPKPAFFAKLLLYMPDDLQLPKAYDSTVVEDAIYSAWTKSGYFTPENLPNLDKRKESYCISLPPPNVTGTLHTGHAVMLAIQDTMIRYARMSGKRALWVPGTDHAAIATNSKVEKILMKEEGKTRHDLGREKFLKRVHDFANKSHDIIVNQMKKMGVSIDWTREAYTIDEKRNFAVRTAFKRMYDDGLIYQGHRVVNWCPRCHSTLADDEVEYKEENGKLYWIKYGPFVLATSRPETKLGDTAVAVHPSDERYKEMVGKKFMIPGVLGEFEITVVADYSVDIEFGTGAVKVTPAHSFVDNEIAQRHGIGMKQIIDEDGRMMKNCGKYAGMTTLEGREAIVTDMEKMGFIDHVEENYKHNLSVCYRCGTTIEPIPSKQWFINVGKEFTFNQSKHNPIKGINDGQTVTLKMLMKHVVENGQIDILPGRITKVYLNWVENLRDWCISRQIWFGHQIPVWYRGEEIYVGVDAPKGEDWEQDPDTLDTWFSSGLWTFSILGWPDMNSEDLKIYHPNSVMETGYDILQLWVTRMILMSTYFLGEIPFKKVYFHGLVRDEQGRKMSKSLENAVDPLDAIKEYGADALRLAMMIGQTPGTDTKLTDDKIASYRNFTNKLWNISRFVFMSVDQVRSIDQIPEPKTLADKWILARYAQVVARATAHYEKYEYSLLGELLRDFTWGEFADWYLEIAKVQKKNGESQTDEILLYVLEGLLKLWHPLMPFVTEELYKQFDRGMMIVAKWPVFLSHPEASEGSSNPVAQFEQLREIVTALRNVRAEYKIAYGKPIDVTIVSASSLEEYQDVIAQMAKTGVVTWTDKATKLEGALSLMAGSIQLYVPVGDLIDFDKERSRIGSELEVVESYIKRLALKLENKEFVDNAPAEVVQAEQGRLKEAQEKQKALKRELDNLG